jgi:hypothetical protein
MRAIIERRLRSFAPVVCVLVFGGLSARAQGPGAQAPADLAAKIEVLTHSIQEMQGELEESRAEIQQLREMIAQILPTQANPPRTNVVDEHAPAVEETQTPSAAAPPAHIAEDDWEILNARVQEHEQTKVESASKYRLKLSGIALFNVFATAGQLDNLDVATMAVKGAPYGAGSVSASFRQSIVGLRGIGPKIFGANTSADLQMDFINSAAGPYGGLAAGVAGLRIARLQFDWSNFSVAGGLETPFFSPNLPTSYLSLAVPAFAGAGNLWNWTPEIRVERRFDFTSSEIKVEAGFVDSGGYSLSGFNARVPTPSESSKQPVYAVRISGNNRMEDQAISFGISGIYVPAHFADGQVLHSAGAIADWKFPFMAKLQLSGQFFAGKGFDGFGGLELPAIQPQDYGHYLYSTAPTLAGIPVLGGWSQLKFTLNNRSEFNAAGGLGARDAGHLRAAAQFDPLLVPVPAGNRVLFFNYIFRPRGDLVFSAEYRHFHNSDSFGGRSVADQIGLAAGFLF